MALGLTVFLKFKITRDIRIIHSLTDGYNPFFKIGTSHGLLHMFLKGFALLAPMSFDIVFSLTINGHFSGLASQKNMLNRGVTGIPLRHLRSWAR